MRIGKVCIVMHRRIDISSMTQPFMPWGEGQGDLYFMVEWFCLISCWRLFDGWMSYLVWWASSTQRLTAWIICRSVTYISWSNDFAYILKTDGWYNGSVWHKDWPHKICVCHWPVFHGPVILPYILKTIWWMKVILCIMDQCDTKIDLIKYI